MDMSLLKTARDMLENVTPLSCDCGRICGLPKLGLPRWGAACCSSAEGECTGMLLFPGEEMFYEGKTDSLGWNFTINDTPQGKRLVCAGTCVRSQRPLACRIFPLTFEINDEGEVHPCLDLLGKNVCPLCTMDISALKGEFVDTVEQVGILLSQDNDFMGHIMMLDDIQRETRQMLDMFGK